MTTKFRTDLVNKFTGISVAVFVIATAGYIGIGGTLFEKIIAWVVIGAGAVIAGYFAAVFINLLQGQNHQSGNDANAEEKRSLNGAVYATGIVGGLFCVTSMFVKIPETLYAIVAICGLAIFVISVAYWGVPALIKLLKK